MKDVELLDLGLTDEDIKEIGIDMIGYKKQVNDILAKSRKQAKGEKCLYCGKEVNSFCNSHSVPAFSLRNIAINGEVYYSNALVDFPLLDTKKGVNKAGTFQLICRECDSKIFSEYENPNNYNGEPTPQMVAQIAMKNYLKLISKRLVEHNIYKFMEEINPLAHGLTQINHHVQDLDLNEAKKGFEKAKRLSKKNWDREYYLFFYKKLDYVVPMAFQSPISLICDLDGAMINNIYNISETYVLQDLHICVFPLQDTSVVMMFVDAEHRRYRSFYKKFNKLTLAEQLGIVNYIIFLYSEDIYMSKTLPDEVLQNSNLIDTSRQTTVGLASIPDTSLVINEAIRKHDLNQWHTIPNLLAEENKLR